MVIVNCVFACFLTFFSHSDPHSCLPFVIYLKPQLFPAAVTLCHRFFMKQPSAVCSSNFFSDACILFLPECQRADEPLPVRLINLPLSLLWGMRAIIQAERHTPLLSPMMWLNKSWHHQGGDTLGLKWTTLVQQTPNWPDVKSHSLGLRTE